MNISARKRLLLILISLFILSVVSLVIYFFIPIKQISFVKNDWGEYQEMYKYRNNEEISLRQRSFSTDLYVVEVLEESNLDVIIYNQNIAENLRKEMSVDEDIEEGCNYVLTVSKGLRDKEEIIELEKKDVAGMKKEYLFKLFEMLEYNQGANFSDAEVEKLEVNSLEELAFEAVGEAFNYYVVEILKEQKFNENEKNRIDEYLSKYQNSIEIDEVTFLPCYTAVKLRENFAYENSEYDLGKSVQQEKAISILRSIYLEDATRPKVNDRLRDLLDEMYYCGVEEAHVGKFDSYIQHLANVSNIDEASIFYISEILKKFKEEGYIDEEIFKPSDYMNTDRYIGLNSDYLYIDCFINECDGALLLNKLPMYIKNSDGDGLMLYTGRQDHDLNVSLFILTILDNE